MFMSWAGTPARPGRQNSGSPGIPVVTRQISLPRRAKPLEIFGRPLNDVLFSREFRESHFFFEPVELDFKLATLLVESRWQRFVILGRTRSPA
jgi:hypothetical protein